MWGRSQPTWAGKSKIPLFRPRIGTQTQVLYIYIYKLRGTGKLEGGEGGRGVFSIYIYTYIYLQKWEVCDQGGGGVGRSEVKLGIGKKRLERKSLRQVASRLRLKNRSISTLSLPSTLFSPILLKALLRRDAGERVFKNDNKEEIITEEGQFMDQGLVRQGISSQGLGYVRGSTLAAGCRGLRK